MKKKHRGTVLPIANWESDQWIIPVQQKPINPVEGLDVIKLTRFSLKQERCDDTARNNGRLPKPNRGRTVQRIVQWLTRKQLVLQTAYAGETP